MLLAQVIWPGWLCTDDAAATDYDNMRDCYRLISAYAE